MKGKAVKTQDAGTARRIQLVAHDRMPYRFEMHPDLMGSAGEGLGLNETRVFPTCEDSVIGPRFTKHTRGTVFR